MRPASPVRGSAEVLRFAAERLEQGVVSGDSGLDLIKTIHDFCEPGLEFRDSDGMDALEIAADSGNTGVLKYLLERGRGL